MTRVVHVELPASLVRLAGCGHTLALCVTAPVTTRAVLDALEAQCPLLEGCLRDHHSGMRRPFIRFFACGEDLSHTSPDDPLPEAVAEGRDPFLIIGALARG